MKHITYIFCLLDSRGHEAIEQRSHIFHLFGWGIPGIQTIIVLTLGKVEGTENRFYPILLMENYEWQMIIYSNN